MRQKKDFYAIDYQNVNVSMIEVFKKGVKKLEWTCAGNKPREKRAARGKLQ